MESPLFSFSSNIIKGQKALDEYIVFTQAYIFVYTQYWSYNFKVRSHNVLWGLRTRDFKKKSVKQAGTHDRQK